MKLFLIRHGETTGDVEDRYGGDYDDHLSSKGREQATALSEKLSGEGIEKIFCSPLIRAQETATILKSKLNVDVITVENVRERNHYGVLTGMVKAEAKKEYPELVEVVKDKLQTVDGGESYQDFGARVSKAFAQVTNSSHDTIAVLSHGGVIRYIFRDILGLGEVDIDDCGFAEFRIVYGKPELVKADGIRSK